MKDADLLKILAGLVAKELEAARQLKSKPGIPAAEADGQYAYWADVYRATEDFRGRVERQPRLIP